MLAALAVAALTGCGSDLRFQRDERLRFVRPPDRAEVTLPVVLEWKVTGFTTVSPSGRELRSGAGFFAVFVDRPPMRPGRDLDSLAEDVDPPCARAAGCPDRQWLEERGVLVSARPRVLIRTLDPDSGRPASHGRRRHDLTVVLLDRRGVRLDESAWRRTIYTVTG